MYFGGCRSLGSHPKAGSGDISKNQRAASMVERNGAAVGVMRVGGRAERARAEEGAQRSGVWF